MTLLSNIVRAARKRLQGQAGFTLPELLLVVVISGLILSVIAGAFLVSAKTTSVAGTRLDESRDAQMVAAYFNADLANSNFFSRTNRAPWSDCSLTGITEPIAMIGWKEGVTEKDAFYFRPTSNKELRRRYCENGVTVSDIPLAQNLAATPPEVTCRPPLGCAPVPGWVNLKTFEGSESYDYELRSTPRSASSTGGGMGGYAIYVGSGGLRLQSAQTDLKALGGAIYNGGTLFCNNNATLTVPGGLYGSTAASACGDTAVSTQVIPVQSDPLSELEYPDLATLSAATTDTTSTCVPGKPTYKAGYYDAVKPTLDGCMAQGVHYFKHGADLNNVKAAAGTRLMIFVEDGPLDLAAHQSETVDFSDLADNDYGNVVIFMHRTTGGKITSNGHVNIDGIIYGAGSLFDAQTPHEDFYAVGVNVKTFNLQANGLLTVP